MDVAFKTSNQIKTNPNWSAQAALLICPRCGSEYLHHEGVVSFDRGEDAGTVVKTEVARGRVTTEPANSGYGNPSSRRDGLVVRFSCEGCGSDPIELCIAQHKGCTEISWRYQTAE